MSTNSAPGRIAAKGAARPERDRLDIAVRADAARTTSTRRRLGRAGGASPAMRRDPVMHLLAVAVVDRDIMAGGSEVPCHRRPHYSQPDKRDLAIAAP